MTCILSTCTVRTKDGGVGAAAVQLGSISTYLVRAEDIGVGVDAVKPGVLSTWGHGLRRQDHPPRPPPFMPTSGATISNHAKLWT
jgi:hypothetical protein